MAYINSTSKPEETYTWEQFISQGNSNEFTYDTFAIKHKIQGYTYVDCSVLENYLPEIKANCVKVTEFSNDEIVKYKYNPDLLAWDLYGNTQLDFLIMMCNDMCDPKEFNFKKKYLYLPKTSIMKDLLSKIYNAEYSWITKSAEEMKN